MGARRILVGEFGRPHGVRGLLNLRAYTEAPDAIAGYGPLTDEGGGRRFAVELLPNGLARVEGVADREAAARLTGTRLFVDRDALPPPEEDEFYLADLVGLRAVSAAGEAMGEVVSVEDYGAGAFLVLRDPSGREREIPFTRRCVPAVSVAGGVLTAVPPDETAPPAADADGEGGAA